ncbi:energy transducer TonB [Aquimarina sp. 2201CG5-10]|uniref:energy transducer TonB family protein n=1 Tax=Aquimarina callyspongiae TaxID=3098150 RepID=UPI002AB33B3B|nr:energy transducer TonB [Aquimarina sp. 2201CG5-10]MDY8135004.1 energy transducer TonB [Aquimarina sp. 2201CG5-10]
MINKQKEQSEILMEIPEELIEELTKQEEEPPQPEEDRQLIASKRTHDAFNEDFEDPDEFEERIKSLTEAEQEIEPVEESPNEEVAIDEPKKEEPKEEAKETNNKYSSSSWSLKGRKLVGKIPNPVYTCNGSGKVVVKIEVNNNGYVVDAKVDKRSSTTRNECLFDNAMDYAKKALFSRSEVKEQDGTITYYFNYSN